MYAYVSNWSNIILDLLKIKIIVDKLWIKINIFINCAKIVQFNILFIKKMVLISFLFTKRLEFMISLNYRFEDSLVL